MHHQRMPKGLWLLVDRLSRCRSDGHHGWQWRQKKKNNGKGKKKKFLACAQPTQTQRETKIRFNEKIELLMVIMMGERVMIA